MPLTFNPLPDKKWLALVSIGSAVFSLGFMGMIIAMGYRLLMSWELINPIPGITILFWSFILISTKMFFVGMGLWTLNEPHHGRGPIGDTHKSVLFVLSFLSWVLYSVAVFKGNSIFVSTDRITFLFYLIFVLPVLIGAIFAWPVMLSHAYRMVCDALHELTVGTLFDWGMRSFVALFGMSLFSLLLGSRVTFYFLLVLFSLQCLIVIMGAVFIAVKSLMYWVIYDQKAAEWEMRHITRAQIARSAREAAIKTTAEPLDMDAEPANVIKHDHFSNTDGALAGGIATGVIYMAGMNQQRRAQQETAIELDETLYVDETELPQLPDEQPLPIAPNLDMTDGLSYENVTLYNKDDYDKVKPVEDFGYDDGLIRLKDEIKDKTTPDGDAAESSEHDNPA